MGRRRGIVRGKGKRGVDEERGGMGRGVNEGVVESGEGMMTEGGSGRCWCGRKGDVVSGMGEYGGGLGEEAELIVMGTREKGVW